MHMVIHAKVTDTRYSKMMKGNISDMKIQVIFFWNSLLMLPPYLALYWGSECETKLYMVIDQRLHIEFYLKHWECLLRGCKSDSETLESISLVY